MERHQAYVLGEGRFFTRSPRGCRTDRFFESIKDMLQKQGIEPDHTQTYRPLQPAPMCNRRDGGHAAPLPKYLRLAQLVPGVVPVSPATIWRWVKAGTFPAPIKLTAHVTAWKLEEVIAWLDARSPEPA